MKSFLERIAGYWRPHAGQLAFLMETAKTKVLACGRRWGKTDACAVAVAHALQQEESTKHMLVAPTVDQARILFRRVIEFLDRLLSSGVSTTSPKPKETPYPHLHYNGHYLVARSAHNPRSLRGHEATHIIVDEAAFVTEEVVNDVLMPMLATTGGCLTLISTPNGHNHFWRMFDLGQCRMDSQYWSRAGPSSENPHIRPGYLEAQKEIVSQRTYLVEYEAQFVDSAGTVFPRESIDRCLVPTPEEVRGPVAIGVDWARYGDFTAIVVVAGSRDQAVVVEVQRFNQISWEKQIDRFEGVLRAYPGAQVLSDATGAGDVILGRLHDRIKDHGIVGFEFTQKSKADLIDGLSSMIDRGTLKIPPFVELLNELREFRAEETKTGTRYSAPNGRHDDLVIALALAVRQLPQSIGPKVKLGAARP